MITHHPADSLLLKHAAGAAHEAVSLIVATHLALCPACRRVVKLAEHAGGILLENLTPEPLTTGAWEHLAARLDEAEAAAPSIVARSGGTPTIPEPLRSYLGADGLDKIRWNFVLPGLAFRPLLPGPFSAKLVRSKPGSSIGLHSHKGEEFSVVLAGGYSDCSGQYRRGDFHTATPDLLHRPVADQGEDCIVLAVTEAPLAFRNPPIGLIASLIGY
ncbi:MAG: cupin domain-containing protein [Alphaproteobacteria bacterium]|nr:cupin domain-containing protein [Alphaproteobacteria bacterium]